MNVDESATHDANPPDTTEPMEVTMSPAVPPSVATQPIGDHDLVVGTQTVRAQQPCIDQGGENQIVFGDQYLPPLPENRDDSSRDDDSDIGEPDPKRLRLTDGYEIALAVMEIPRTYEEAMASPEAAEWKE
ncbi:hypothetical protein PsorP6_006567 [Peronosclerospora sorghi]|uniref:Uncharacterized protein n=1 Tax=Peronosclerospora sorghi TaxID=230839 RepID=A0ACC0W434_9STRA|nr:hypothetical protein PsorP6_006567 [Peronosclerospora sorghi]